MKWNSLWKKCLYKWMQQNTGEEIINVSMIAHTVHDRYFFTRTQQSGIKKQNFHPVNFATCFRLFYFCQKYSWNVFKPAKLKKGFVHIIISSWYNNSLSRPDWTLVTDTCIINSFSCNHLLCKILSFCYLWFKVQLLTVFNSVTRNSCTDKYM